MARDNFFQHETRFFFQNDNQTKYFLLDVPGEDAIKEGQCGCSVTVFEKKINKEGKKLFIKNRY